MRTAASVVLAVSGRAEEAAGAVHRLDCLALVDANDNQVERYALQNVIDIN